MREYPAGRLKPNLVTDAELIEILNARCIRLQSPRAFARSISAAEAKRLIQMGHNVPRTSWVYKACRKLARS